MLICVVGPTACYKSDTAIRLAKTFDGEVISCDSVSVYKGLDIGSAKPTISEQKEVRHHLLDVADPFDTSFSVSSFRSLADASINFCLQNNILPVVCGGSGLYLDAILHNMTYACPASPEIRDQLNYDYENDPIAFISRLHEVDPQAADRIPLKDKKRLVRAMEVFLLSGKPFSSYNQDYIKAQSIFRYKSIRIGLTLPREALYTRINHRVDIMMERGLLQEVQSLRKKGLDLSYPAMQSIGYKQLLQYLEGVYSLKEAVDEIKLATRHLAKRQLTWFKRDPGIIWFDCSEPEKTYSKIVSFIEEKIND